jgi:hypothetical protein
MRTVVSQRTRGRTVKVDRRHWFRSDGDVGKVSGFEYHGDVKWTVDRVPDYDYEFENLRHAILDDVVFEISPLNNRLVLIWN